MVYKRKFLTMPPYLGKEHKSAECEKGQFKKPTTNRTPCDPSLHSKTIHCKDRRITKSEDTNGIMTNKPT